MQFIFIILIMGLFLWLIWFIFYKTFLWTINPLVKHFEEKNKEQKEIHDTLIEIKDKLGKDRYKNDENE